MRRPALAITLALLACPSLAEAGAWTRPEGTSYAKVSAKALVGNRAFVTGRTTTTLPANYQDFQLSLYGEYGVTDAVTAVFEATPLGVLSYDGETDPYIGGAIASVRYRLQVSPIALAVQLHAGGRPGQATPTGVHQADDRTLVVTPVVGTLLGGGSINAGWSKGPTWLTGHLGARFHSAETLDTAFFAFLQFGWHIADWLTAALHVTWWHSLGELEPINVLGTANTRYLGYGLGLTVWVTDGVGLHAGIDGAVYAASNAATPALMLGLEFR